MKSNELSLILSTLGMTHAMNLHDPTSQKSVIRFSPHAYFYSLLYLEENQLNPQLDRQRTRKLPIDNEVYVRFDGGVDIDNGEEREVYCNSTRDRHVN